MEDVGYRLKFRNAKERFHELWGMKAHVRENVKDWLVASNVQSRISEICATACSELLENCIKYTSNGAVAVVSVHLSDQTIIVETINPAHGDHIALLHESLDTLQAALEPKQLFVKHLLNPIAGKSRLGLIRIVLETRGTLELVQEKEKEIVHLKLHVKRG